METKKIPIDKIIIPEKLGWEMLSLLTKVHATKVKELKYHENAAIQLKADITDIEERLDNGGRLAGGE